MMHGDAVPLPVPLPVPHAVNFDHFMSLFDGLSFSVIYDKY
jgi:hypothetical protein